MKKAISACLAGEKVRYDAKVCPSIIDNKDDYLLICPEVLGGLSTPRNPVEIQGQIITNAYDDLVNKDIKIVDQYGDDFSQNFLDGANKVYEQLKENNIDTIILKSKSPSCGSGLIYDGNFSKTLIEGDGVLSALLKKHDIKVINNDDL